MKNTCLLLIGFIFLVSCSSTSGDSEALANGDGSGWITAGEWNDLDHWDFWNDLITKEEFVDMADYWQFYPQNRISVLVTHQDKPVVDADIKLEHNALLTVWAAKTDNLGRAELWINPFSSDTLSEYTDYRLLVNGQVVNAPVQPFSVGVNGIQLNAATGTSNHVDLAFIVDATGSMSDELEFLKDDLQDVIERVTANNASLEMSTASVFYRDEGEAYVTRKSDFTSELGTTINFIEEQKAQNGGDFPEAVHSAVSVAIEELQWSDLARTRIALLLLDAPPHYQLDVISSLQSDIRLAAEKGIKLIPITASGIDKETEFLMRYFSIFTNGTYVFITNDSGIGEQHLTASVGEYEVEYLNDLLVRLIEKYTE